MKVCMGLATPAFLPPQPSALSTLGLAKSNASLLTVGNKKAPLPGFAQDSILCHFFPKALEQAFL
jgi:hypothetical protein